MPRERSIQVAAINLAANPHPPGVYFDILNSLSKRRVEFRGNDRGKITAPQITDDPDLYTGRILIWTDFNRDEPWVDLGNETALDEALKDELNIPEHARPNFRVFNYAFYARKHRMYFESTNEFGKVLGPTSAARLMGRLIDSANLAESLPEINVTVVPAHGAVRAVLDLPGLRVLEITVVLPNADADADGEDRVFQRLNAARASRLTERYTKQREADHLVPTDEITALAHVASKNGEVVGVGRENGKRKELSTAKIPRQEAAQLDWGEDFISRLRRIGLF